MALLAHQTLHRVVKNQQHQQQGQRVETAPGKGPRSGQKESVKRPLPEQAHCHHLQEDERAENPEARRTDERPQFQTEEGPRGGQETGGALDGLRQGTECPVFVCLAGQVTGSQRGQIHPRGFSPDAALNQRARQRHQGKSQPRHDQPAQKHRDFRDRGGPVEVVGPARLFQKGGQKPAHACRVAPLQSLVDPFGQPCRAEVPQEKSAAYHQHRGHGEHQHRLPGQRAQKQGRSGRE